ncbi:MAG: hypothetical protein HND53_12060 [Proteobacteria bacterium]|nr:hypothetical protein [Pseudomonadota bacterium]NOG61228.1 hypothetical protein [Pseudomonadota bacterium]
MIRLLFFTFIFLANLHYVFAASTGGSLCFSDEDIVFSCGTTNGKIISLCSSFKVTASDGFLQYRFGSVGDIPEFIFPKVMRHPKEFFLSGTIPYSGGGASYLKFIRGDYSYTVFTGIGKGWEKEGVVVNKTGKEYSTILCAGPIISELGPALFEKLELKKDPNEPEFDVP